MVNVAQKKSSRSLIKTLINDDVNYFFSEIMLCFFMTFNFSFSCTKIHKSFTHLSKRNDMIFHHKIFLSFFSERTFSFLFLWQIHWIISLTGTFISFLFSLTSEGNTRCFYSYEKKCVVICAYYSASFFSFFTYFSPSDMEIYIFFVISWHEEIFQTIANLFFIQLLDDKNFLALSKRVVNFLLLISSNLSEIFFIF